MNLSKLAHGMAVEERMTDLPGGKNEVIGAEYQCLDKGFIRVVDAMGDEDAIVQAARVSYGKGTKTVNQDVGLIRYLLRHKHTTPFEMCEIKLHIKMPIFVARQLIRHRTANVNEYSGRYSIMSDDCYLPTPDRLGRQSKDNKQGTGEALPVAEAMDIIECMRTEQDILLANYKTYTDEDDLARELARINLPLSNYTEFYWKIDVHNWMHFMHLRADPHAQKEIREFAEAMEDVLRRWMPNVFVAYLDYIKNARMLSWDGVMAIQSAVENDPKIGIAIMNSLDEMGVSTREIGEIMNVFANENAQELIKQMQEVRANDQQCAA